MKVNRQLLESRADAAAFLQPADALLDDRPLAIRLFVELHCRIPASRLVLLVRNHCKDALLFQPVADALHAVGFVGGELPGLFAASLLPRGDEGCDHRLKALRFMHLAGAELERQRSSLAVSNQVEFRSKPASAAAPTL